MMTAVHNNLSCSQSSLFWESFQTLSDEDVVFGAQHNSNKESGLLPPYASISRVLGIIESAEDLMFSSDCLFHEEDLEPIPIGPDGIQTIIPPINTPAEPATTPALSFLKPESIMSGEDLCHAAISMPTFLDMKNQSISAAPECEEILLLDSFITTMKREAANSCGDTCHQEQPMAKKQKRTRTISADMMAVPPLSILVAKQETRQEESSGEDDDTANDNDNMVKDEGEVLDPGAPRFRRYQADQWMERFDDLVQFKAENGHCLVPHDFPPNQQLAQWVKRQRYQYKLKMMGRHSTLTDERQEELEQMGFVWDSHKAAWDERLESLKKYCATFGNCLVPTNYEDDRSLAVWVKCQRRQMKLFRSGRRSTMTQDRFEALDRLGFEWNPRNL